MSDLRTHSSVESALSRLRDSPSLGSKLARASLHSSLFGEPGEAVRVGRFMLLERIGVGAMGVVYAAYDPELDRRVALKVLREPGDSPQARESAATRLRREAQAMARLDHENVVKVFDVGRQEELMYVAMEEVEGVTLRRWLDDGHSPAEIVSMFVLAGRGLAAAHEAGLIHRDFKPDNVLVDGGGRPRVADFGLARSVVDARTSGATEGAMTTTSDTRTGSIMGTPAYMAPEQIESGPVDARSDQFSFCVALWEALFGRRPFEGNTLAELSLAIRRGECAPTRTTDGVSARVQEALRRGLRHEPGQRWNSMAALLDALEPPQKTALVSSKVALLGVVGLGIAGVVSALVLSRAALPGPPCVEAGGDIERIWNAEARTRTERGLLEASGDWGPQAAATVLEAVDGYAASWQNARVDTCRATHVRHSQSERRLDLRMACLDRRLGEFEALVDMLARPDAAAAAQAAWATEQLTSVEVCDDIEAVESAQPLPEEPTMRAKVIAQWPKLAELKAKLDAGQYDAVVELARTVRSDTAEVLDAYPPAAAELLSYQGRAHARLGQWSQARSTLEGAAQAAIAAGDRIRARDAWIWLARLEGSAKSDPERGRLWLALGRAELVRQPDRQASLFADESEVSIALAEGKAKEALALMEKVVAARHDEPSSRRRLRSLTNLANANHSAGDYERAADLHNAAVTLAKLELGATHPEVATQLARLGDSLRSAGQLAEATQAYEASLAMAEKNPHNTQVPRWMAYRGLSGVAFKRDEVERGIEQGELAVAATRASLGADDVRIAFALVNLGQGYTRASRFEDARITLQEALEMLEVGLGPDHPHVGAVVGTLADIHYREKNYTSALEMYERGLVISEKKLGREHPRLAFQLQGAAQALIELGRASEALPLLKRAITLREKNGPESPLLVLPLTEVARALIALDRPQEAIEPARRALTIQKPDGSPVYRAYAQWQLAQGLYATGQRAQGRKLAREALETLEAQAEDGEIQDQIRAWLGG